MYDLLENCGEPVPSSGGGGVVQPRKTSDVLVVGRSHEFVEDEKRFRIPVFCSYCDGMLQRESFVQHAAPTLRVCVVCRMLQVLNVIHAHNMLYVCVCDV